MGFLNIFSKVMTIHLRQLLVNFLKQLNDYSENGYVSKFFDDFLLVVTLHWQQKGVILHGPY